MKLALKNAYRRHAINPFLTLGFVALLAAACSAAEIPPPDELRRMADGTMRDFCAAIEARNFSRFLQNTSTPMKQQVTPERLRAAFQDLMDSGADLSGSRSVAPVFEPAPAKNEDGLLVLSGRYPAKPLGVAFVFRYFHEKTGWRLAGCRVEIRPPLPSESEQLRLTNRTMADFWTAIQARNFTSFYNTVSTPWKRKVKAAEFQEAFQPYLNNGTDLSGVLRTKPTFDAPASLHENGVLELAGRYLAKPQSISFNIQYFFEKSVWKLVRITVDYGGAQPVMEQAATATTTVPSSGELQRLARSFLMDFDTAIRARSFTDFYEKLSEGSKKQTTAAELQAAFQPFIDQQFDVSGIRNLTAVFDEPPAVKNGQLALSGHYPTTPNLTFSIKCVREESDWKLEGIEVGHKKNP